MFTASLSTAVPIDSDNVGTTALNIDLVSRRYGVLFVLPTGNLSNLDGDQPSADLPNFFDPAGWFADPNARMGRPGESFNAITVASYAASQVDHEQSSPGHATLYSRRGPGPKEFPKPDLAEAGGNCVLYVDGDDSAVVTGIGVDPENPKSGLRNLESPVGIRNCCGTSYAVPKVAFSLARLLKTFEGLGEERHAPLLAKAYLAHICRVPDAAGPFPADWTSGERAGKRHLLYGHGVPDPAALDGVLPSEVCFYSATEIKRRQRHVFTLRLPANVINALPDVRLRVTLAYFTRVEPQALDADLYSLIELAPVVRWGGKTLQKLARCGELKDFYPLKNFEVRFARPREGEPAARG